MRKTSCFQNKSRVSFDGAVRRGKVGVSTIIGLAAAVVVLLAIGFVGFVVFVAMTDSSTPVDEQVQSVQSGPPDYAFTSLDGRELTPATLKGKIVFIDFWATWCGPCRTTLPELEKLAQAFPNDLVVIGVSNEPKATVAKFLSGKSITYPMVAPAPTVGKPFSMVRAIPTIFIIRRDGSLAQMMVGSHDFEQLAEAFRMADSMAVR